MADRMLYPIVFMLAKALAMLPMRVLYALSDLLYIVIYYVARYRRPVVRTNLKNSFPEKTDKERLRIERKFYRHFTDYIVETVKLAGISQAELLSRSRLLNPEMVKPLLAQGRTCLMLVMGHYGNWEWFTGFPSCFCGDLDVYQIYRPLNNRAFDKLFIYLRTRFGAYGIKKKEAARDIFRLKNDRTPSLVVFIADQTPSRANLHYWTNFLNQDTAILNGPERIAVKLDLPVIYADVKQLERGRYAVDFQLMTDRPRETPPNWITEEYARRMEKTILREPAYWLWTHKRWKHKRVENGELRVENKP